jgi:hypothetical protein
MKRTIVVCAMIFAAAAALGAQQTSQSDRYQGISNPPANDEVIVTTTPQAKPSAGKPLASSAVQKQVEMQTSSDAAPINNSTASKDDGIVHGAPAAPQASAQLGFAARTAASDPDGDIVHPHTLAPGELGEGTTIRVRLLQRLSTAFSEKGEVFRTKVASDVLRDGQVMIPAGAEIDGKVVEVSSGRMAGHGTLRLLPETVILLDGTRYQLHAYATGTPGSNTHVEDENSIVPDSRAKRDGIEYGGAVGAGVTTGAIVGGPVGALTGGLIGAGVVTAHLLISHPQAVLETGTVILFTLSEPLQLVPAVRREN